MHQFSHAHNSDKCKSSAAKQTTCTTCTANIHDMHKQVASQKLSVLHDQLCLLRNVGNLDMRKNTPMTKQEQQAI